MVFGVQKWSESHTNSHPMPQGTAVSHFKKWYFCTNVVTVWGYMRSCTTYGSNGPFGARNRLWGGRLGSLFVIPRRGKKYSCYPEVSFSGLSGHYTEFTTQPTTSILYWRITGVLDPLIEIFSQPFFRSTHAHALLHKPVIFINCKQVLFCTKTTVSQIIT